MKKRDVFLTLLLPCLGCVLSGCSKDAVGIAPYELTKEEQSLLASFGMTDTSRIFRFHAPKEAVALHINAYQLDTDGKWKKNDDGAVSIDSAQDSVQGMELKGTLAMEMQDDYSIDFHVNCAGRSSFTSDAGKLAQDHDYLASGKGFLDEFQNIELNKEIPIAVIIYDNGTSMRSYSVNDYFEPSVFEGMDLVQAITVEFSEQEL